MSSNANHRTSSDLPPGWKWTTLDEVAVVLDSQRVPINADEREQRIAKKKPHEVYPYFGATGQVGWIDGYLFDEELVLLGEDGAPFIDPGKSKAYIIKGRTWVNNHAHVLRANAGLTLNSYLMHVLNIFDYHGFVTGTTRLKLNQSEMRKIPIPLPPLPEQHRIVAEIEKQFTRLDAGVVALKRVQANLKRYRASVLKAACEGRLAPQDPADEPADRLLARILAERRAKWEAEHPGKKYVEPAAPVMDGLAELPAGWCWARMERLIADFRSGTTAVPHDEPTDFPILRSSSVRPMTIDYSDIRYLGQEDSLSPSNFLRVSDLLFTRLSGSLDYVGNCALVDNSEAAAIQYPDRIFRAQLTEPRCTPFVEVFFSSPVARTQIKALAKSTAGHQRISMGAISKHMIPLPPLPEQHRIVAEVERRLSVVAELEATVAANLARAGRLRQAVLKRAFEGRLVAQDVGDEPAQLLLGREAN